jgi:hypothetical protein
MFVRVHSCSDPRFDDGTPFLCRCDLLVRPGVARKLVGVSTKTHYETRFDGTVGKYDDVVRSENAFWKKQRRADGRMIELKDEIVLSCEKPFVVVNGKRVYTRRHRRAQPSITKKNIEDAYTESAEYQAGRIEEYAELTQETLGELRDEAAPDCLAVEIIEKLPGETLAQLHERTHLERPSRREVLRHRSQARRTTL